MNQTSKEFNPLSRLLMRLTNIQENELRAAVLSFLFVFILMAAYYLLRPVRDAMASDWTDAEVSWLWTLNFFKVSLNLLTRNSAFVIFPDPY